MFYLILNERIVDKSVAPFPVHKSLTWIEDKQDISITGNECYRNGEIIFPDNKKSPEEIIEFKKIIEKDLTNIMLKRLMILPLDNVQKDYQENIIKLNEFNSENDLNSFYQDILDKGT